MTTDLEGPPSPSRRPSSRSSSPSPPSTTPKTVSVEAAASAVEAELGAVAKRRCLMLAEVSSTPPRATPPAPATAPLGAAWLAAADAQYSRHFPPLSEELPQRVRMRMLEPYIIATPGATQGEGQTLAAAIDLEAARFASALGEAAAADPADHFFRHICDFATRLYRLRVRPCGHLFPGDDVLGLVLDVGPQADALAEFNSYTFDERLTVPTFICCGLRSALRRNPDFRRHIQRYVFGHDLLTIPPPVAGGRLPPLPIEPTRAADLRLSGPGLLAATVDALHTGAWSAWRAFLTPSCDPMAPLLATTGDATRLAEVSGQDDVGQGVARRSPDTVVTGETAETQPRPPEQASVLYTRLVVPFLDAGEAARERLHFNPNDYIKSSLGLRKIGLQQTLEESVAQVRDELRLQLDRAPNVIETLGWLAGRLHDFRRRRRVERRGRMVLAVLPNAIESARWQGVNSALWPSQNPLPDFAQLLLQEILVADNDGDDGHDARDHLLARMTEEGRARKSLFGPTASLRRAQEAKRNRIGHLCLDLMPPDHTAFGIRSLAAGIFAVVGRALPEA